MAQDYTLSVVDVNLISITDSLFIPEIKLSVMENGNPVLLNLLEFTVKDQNNNIINCNLTLLNTAIKLLPLSLNNTLSIEARNLISLDKYSNTVSLSLNPASLSYSNLKYSKEYLSKHVDNKLIITVTISDSNNTPISYNTSVDITVY